MTLSLPNVTVVTIDTEEHKLTRLALNDTLKEISPAEVHIYANQFQHYHMLDANVVYQFPLHKKLTTEEIYKTLWYTVPQHLTTSHVLTIQWDGWVLDSSLWTDEFLYYDYIGAPWPWHNTYTVGNGGFSLRSTKLLKTLSANRGSFPFRLPCDEAICRTYRPWLEDRGLKFAPEDLAWKFSREHSDPDHDGWDSFGFHDPRNFPYWLNGDRLRERFAAAGPYATQKFAELGVKAP